MPSCVHCYGTGQQNRNTCFRDPSTLCNPTNTCPPCAKIASIQERIDATRRVLSELLDEKEAMASAFNAEHDKLCRNLPTELVSEVFLHTLPRIPSLETFQASDWPLDDWEVQFYKTTPQRLSSVCRQWRATARTTPKLWTIVRVAFGYPGSTAPDFAVFQEWLQLSRQLPLYLRLDFAFDLTFQRLQPYLPQISSSLLPHINRMLALAIQGPTDFLSYLFAQWTSLHLQCLKIQPGNPFHLNLKAAPGVFITLGPVKFSFLDYSNLRDISFGQISWGKFLHILQNASNLLTCKIEGFVREDGGLGLGMVVHHNLKTLIIYNMSQINWDLLCLPDLQDLNISTAYTGENHATSVIGFLHRSKCKLYSLRYNSTISEEDVVQIVTCSPTLTHIFLERIALTDLFFLCTTRPLHSNSYEQHPLINNLETLDSAVEVVDWDTIVLFIKSRSKGNGGRLHTVNLYLVQNSLENGLEVGPDGVLILDPAIVVALTEAAEGVKLRISDEYDDPMLDIK